MGENLDKNGYTKAMRMLTNTKQMNSYMLEVGNKQWIDGKRKANIARFINHSCVPNLKCEKYTNKFGMSSVHFVAVRDIKVGCELTFDYGNGFSAGRWAFECQCEECK
eukprot:538039_1